MTGIRVTHTVDRLERDLRAMPSRAARGMAELVRDAARDGNARAKAFARASAGSHGRHYHKAFTVERLSRFEYEYGPDAARPQGGMSFEYGSRNQPPHLDLNRSADVVGPQMAAGARRLLDDLFW